MAEHQEISGYNLHQMSESLKKNLDVTKSTGEHAAFSVDKLSASLRRSGADTATIKEVLRQLDDFLYEGIPTRRIYNKAFMILKRISKPVAARYSLKQGIMQLGPTGFPFEKFVAELLKSQGYATRIGVFVDGHCVRHEIDIIVVKDGLTNMIECKFRNLKSNKSDVKVPMYIHSRFKDVEQVQVSEFEFKTRFHQSWVVTNTRFTEDAIQYAMCMNMRLIGWDYPSKGGLKDYVNSFALYPITCLTTLTLTDKQKLLDKGIVLCKEVQHNRQILLNAGIKEARVGTVMKEINALLNSDKAENYKV